MVVFCCGRATDVPDSRLRGFPGSQEGFLHAGYEFLR